MLTVEKYIFVYVTFPDSNIAKEISKVIVQEKLAACANILPNIESVFLWEEELNVSSESACIYKTKQSCYAKLEERIMNLHPYKTTCIVSFDVASGFANFLNWINLSTTN